VKQEVMDHTNQFHAKYAKKSKDRKPVFEPSLNPKSQILIPAMRLDIFLKHSRLVPRRTLAQQMCEAGAVRVNDARAKSAREVRVGDVIAVKQRGRITTVRVIDLPLKPPSKAQAASMYETLGVESYDPG
jgi:ribosomal 50S subunit-recycling heat shock protein